MKRLLLALLLIPMFAAMAAAQTSAPAGDPVAGKALWDGNTTSCKNCHAAKAEGGFGPDLAGRKLTWRSSTTRFRSPGASCRRSRS